MRPTEPTNAADGHLVGRRRERDALTGLLRRAESGAAVSLILRGPMGQGKTALLDWAMDEARRAGFTVARTTGVQLDDEVGFGALAGLLRPLDAHVAHLDPELSRALRNAVRLGADPTSPLAVFAATLALLAEAAESGPLLVVVDDAQWVDRSSLQAVLFAAHRCGSERIAFLLARRDGDPSALDQVQLPTLDLSPLDPDDAVELLGRHAVVPVVAAELSPRCAGNPLALVEGARHLTAGQRRGDEPLPPVPPVGGSLGDALRREMAELTDATRLALGAAAIEPGDDLAVVEATIVATGGRAADLEPAERGRVVQLRGGRVRWRHPLLRTAAYQALTLTQRRALHRAAADVHRGRGSADHETWHLAASTSGPDEDVALRLVGVARRARERGALDAAAHALDRAAQLAGSPRLRLDRVVEAADIRWLIGRLQPALTALRRELARADDPADRARITVLLGQVEMWATGPRSGAAQQEAHARAVRASHPALAAELLMHAGFAHLLALDVPGAQERCGRAQEAAADSGDGWAVFQADTATRIVRAISGDPGVELEPLLQLADALAREGTGFAMVQICGLIALAREQWDTATDLLTRLVASGIATGASGRTIIAQTHLADVLWRQGRWSEARAEIDQAVSLHRAVGIDELVPLGDVATAQIAAGRGDAEACHHHADRAEEIARRQGNGYLWVRARSARLLLDLGAGRHGDAAENAESLVPATAGVPDPGLLWWQADAIEALARAGRVRQAATLLDRLEEQAEATGRRWARAAASRAGALLGREAPERRFADALDDFTAMGAPFEIGRTHLLRGEHRRRTGSAAAAERDLATAREIFIGLGARSWTARTEATAPATTPAPAAPLTDRLTPTELKVARVVAEGASDKEAAARLYMSRKTVGSHLQSIYRKLDVKRRGQLAPLLLGDAGARR